MTRVNRVSTRVCFSVLALYLLSAPSIAQSRRVGLQSGLQLEGTFRRSKALSSDPALQGAGDTGLFRVLDEKFKRYYFSYKLVGTTDPPDAFKGKSFKLKHRRTSRRRMPDLIGGFTAVTPWDENGVRTVTIQLPKGAMQIIQAVDKLTANYIWIRSLSHNWTYGIPTTSMPPADLDKILRRAINLNNQQDRLDAVQFLLEADQLKLAGDWIGGLASDFPALQKQAKAATLDLRRAYGEKVLGELGEREKAGQHQLVQANLAGFPRKELPVAVLNTVEQWEEAYENRKSVIARLNQQLEQLESVLEPKLKKRVQPLRAIVKRDLDYSSIERLQSYITLSKDKTLKPHERLALAYSGWLLGSGDAKTNLQETLGLWDALPHIATYLESTDPLERQRALDTLDRLEGVSPRPLANLLAVSAPREAVNVTPGRITPMYVSTDSGDVNYKVVLPPEYSPYRTYPMIVTLRQANLRTDDAIAWWAGTEQNPLQAQRRGYVVIAPDYLPPGAKTYESTAEAHQIVMQSIRDAFKRFSIDTDRVFLTGHGSGGDATFDIGMSFPGVFAGAIPICGLMGPECSRLTTNAATLPWYFVTGERYRDSLAHNSKVLEQIVAQKRNEKLMVCEYKGRGFETYYDEIHNLFEWMETYEREPVGKEFNAATVRPENGSLFWIEASGFPEYLNDQDFSRDKKVRLRNVEFDLRVTKTNTIQIRRAGAKKLTLRLMDGVVNFEKSIRLDGGRIARGKKIDPKPAIQDVLDDYRLYRDGKRIALQRVELK